MTSHWQSFDFSWSFLKVDENWSIKYHGFLSILTIHFLSITILIFRYPSLCENPATIFPLICFQSIYFKSHILYGIWLLFLASQVCWIPWTLNINYYVTMSGWQQKFSTNFHGKKRKQVRKLTTISGHFWGHGDGNVSLCCSYSRLETSTHFP